MAMHIYSPLSNAWANFDVSIVGDDDNEIYSFSKGLSYYYGYEGGESWSEGTQKAKAYFKVPESGSYKFVISGEGGTGEWSDGTLNISSNVTLRQGVKLSRYLFLTFLFMLGCAVIPRLWFARE